MDIKKYSYNYPWALPFTAWLLFSVFYGYAAWTKGFNVDEFYSWVYAQNCSYWEILTLKDGGIAHPPLFHFLQKLVQDMVPGYHFLYPRLLNYFLGSLFVWILVRHLLKAKKTTLFLISIPMAASTLDAFIFSRMYGLVTLFSLLFYLASESYFNQKNVLNLSRLIFVFFAGLLSDYSFVIMVPYLIISLTIGSKHRKKYVYFFIISLLIFVLFFFLLSGYSNGFENSVYTAVYNFLNIGFKPVQLILNFNYWELILIPMLILFIAIYFENKKIESLHYILIFLFIATMLSFLIQANMLRVRHIVILILPTIYFLFIVIKRYPLNRIWSDTNNRLIFALTFGLIIVYEMNFISWTNLFEIRFLMLFSPLILVLIHNRFSRKILYLFAFVFVFSGFNYIFSSKISSQFTSGVVDYRIPVIYKNTHEYATQYFKMHHSPITPFFLSKSRFKEHCRVCAMGTTDIDYSKIDSLIFISWENELPIKLLLRGYKISGFSDFGLTKTDKWQLKHLTPLISQYFTKWEMNK